MHDTPQIFHIWQKMDIWRSRIVTWPSLPVCPIALSLVWNLDWETSNLCQFIWQAIYFKFILKRNEKMYGNRGKQCLLWAQSWREVKRVLCYNALWWSPCDCVMWYVNKCCLKLSSVVLQCLSNPHGTSDVLFSKPCYPGPVKWLELSQVYLGQLLVK